MRHLAYRFCRKELQYILSFKIGDIIKDFRADKELYFQLNVGDDGRIEYKGENLIAFEHN